MENDEVTVVIAAKLDAIIVEELMPLDGRSVDIGSMLARQIEKVVVVSHLHDLRMIARCHGIGNHQILFAATSDGERKADQGNRVLLLSLNVQQHGSLWRPKNRVLH